MATPVTGDLYSQAKASPQQGVTLHNMPVYPASVLRDINSKLNQKAESGKKFGALVTASGFAKPVLYQAGGSNPESPWLAVTNDGADIVPAVPTP